MEKDGITGRWLMIAVAACIGAAQAGGVSLDGAWTLA